MPSSHNRCHQAYSANIGLLIERFPVSFNRDRPLPLPRDAFEIIIATPDLGIDDDNLDYTLACWTQRREYCRSICDFGHRYSLDGSPLEPIPQEEIDRQEERRERFIRRGML